MNWSNIDVQSVLAVPAAGAGAGDGDGDEEGAIVAVYDFAALDISKSAACISGMSNGVTDAVGNGVVSLMSSKHRGFALILK